MWQADTWTPPRRLLFSQLLIPTMDSTRTDFIMKSIGNLDIEKSKLRNEKGLRNTLLVGGNGTAKTSIVIMYSRQFDPLVMSFKRINFSSATEPINF